jgi:hypothetical protein
MHEAPLFATLEMVGYGQFRCFAIGNPRRNPPRSSARPPVNVSNAASENGATRTPPPPTRFSSPMIIIIYILETVALCKFIFKIDHRLKSLGSTLFSYSASLSLTLRFSEV